MIPEHPRHPEMVPLYHRPGSVVVWRTPPSELPYDVEWVWEWTRCNGDMVTAYLGPDEEPSTSVCRQPGVCVVHDPPGTVVPW